MKTWILAIAMMTGVTMSAQDGGRKTDRPHHDKERIEHRAHLTPEQRAELRAKQLTLALDLSDKQQKDVQKLIQGREAKNQELIAKHKTDKEAGKMPTDNERFAMRSQMLEDRIALKREMKKILTADQYAKFEKMKDGAREKGFKGERKFKNAKRK
jgi:Spy/CpxP family protein refolding chaperone